MAGSPEIVLFPTYGSPSGDGLRWNLSVHGWIYDADPFRRVVRSMVKRFQRFLFRSYLRYKTQEEARELLQERERGFFVSNYRGRLVEIRVGNALFTLSKSEANGHFRGMIPLETGLVEQYAVEGRAGTRWIPFQAEALINPPLKASGKIRLIPEEGISVISDFDDTIKESIVRDRGELLANTFLREFRTVEGIVRLYQEWEKQGAIFHYVSSSPWQLYPSLNEFLRQSGLPEGTLHLRTFRLRDSRWLRFLIRPRETKPKSIERILRAFPKRKFILVGDSGERDPEIYGAAARNASDRIQSIWIRLIPSSNTTQERFQEAFAGLPAALWNLYHHADEIPRKIVVSSPLTGNPGSLFGI